MRRARAPALPGPDAPLPPGPLPPASCIQGEGSAAGGGKRGSDAGLAPPLITPRQERLQAPLASTVTAALTPCTQGQGPGADSGLSAAVTFPRQTRCSCRSPGAAGGCSGVAALPGGEAAPQTPQCRWAPRGMAARHSTGGCPRGKGVKGCACSRVSSLCPTHGLGSICRDEARTRQDGEGWPCSAELRAREGRGGRPPSAGSTADLWDGQAGCAVGVPCPLEKMPVWEFASGRAVRNPHALRSRHRWRVVGAGRAGARAVAVGALSPGGHRAAGLRVPGLCVRGCAGRWSSQSHTHGAAMNPTSTPGSWG